MESSNWGFFVNKDANQSNMDYTGNQHTAGGERCWLSSGNDVGDRVKLIWDGRTGIAIKNIITSSDDLDETEVMRMSQQHFTLVEHTRVVKRSHQQLQQQLVGLCYLERFGIEGKLH